MDYISNTPEDREKMLKTAGVEEVEELFSMLPAEVALQYPLAIPSGLSEMELIRDLKEKAARNRSLDEMTSFLGAGAYDHYIPHHIDHLVSRSEFYTAYTPYQAELSQGTLQAIYEYQSMICSLTGMDIANASLLDGASATGEAVTMAARIIGKSKILLAETIHPAYRQVAKTYGRPQGLDFVEISTGTTGGNEGVEQQLAAELDNETAAVVVQYPNFYGTIEDMKRIQELTTEKEILLIVIANPIALGLLTSPSKFGADIVIGEGQSLGNELNYGGPYLGFMATREKRNYLRQMPGRIAGVTTDVDDKKGYVLTLQTREQHIRRERATSNICSNEALSALKATIYLATMGKQGIREVAEQCLQKAHYLAGKIDKLNGYRVKNIDNFFHEFWLETPLPAAKLNKKLAEKGIIGGLNLSSYTNEDGLLVCVTEKRTKDEMDSFVSALEVLVND